ncbi:MAG: hypothetical protein AB7F61_17320 [Desulfobulbus sp.]
MSIFKKIGKSLLVAGIFMMLASPVMAGNGKGPGNAKHLYPKCSCCIPGVDCPEWCEVLGE